MFLIALLSALIGPGRFFVPDDDPKAPLVLLLGAGCEGGPPLCPLDRGLGRWRGRRLREIEDRDDDDWDEHDNEDVWASSEGFFFLSFGTNLVYLRGDFAAGGISAVMASPTAREDYKTTNV
jgi:hypothetical protein